MFSASVFISGHALKHFHYQLPKVRGGLLAETLHLAPTRFCHLPGSHCKTWFLSVIPSLCNSQNFLLFMIFFCLFKNSFINTSSIWKLNIDLNYTKSLKKYFSRQSLKRFRYFLCQINRLNIFLLGLFPIIKLIWHEKLIFLSILREKYCLSRLEILKRPKKLNYNVEILFKSR